MTRFEQDAVAVEYPEGWQRSTEEDGRGGLVLRVFGPSGVDGAPVRVGVYIQPREHASAAQYGRSAAVTRPADLKGRVVARAEADVAGADGAWRVETDYALARSGADPVPARLVDVLPVKGDFQYRLTISGPREAIGGSEAEAIIASFRVDGG